MSGQSGGYRVRLSKLNEQLTCKLCGGYFIDATTIIECLHSFCRSCIVKYLESNKYCPICEVQVHKSRPLLNIRPDHTLQDIVYKLVPGCYQNEMRCRREFYAKHPEVRSQVTSPEARGEPIESHIYSPDESLSLSLEYFNPCMKDLNEANAIKDVTQKPLLRRYLRCPAAVTVFHLQKLIRAKYGLTDAHRVDIMYKEEPLCNSYTLMDVMYIYHWRRKVPLHLSYRIFESSSKRVKLSEDNASYKSLLTNAGIYSVEAKDEKSSKREWKEVQLKISETGVMSITDISNTVLKRDMEIENLQDQKTSEETISSIVAMDKTDLLPGNCGMSKSPADATQTVLGTDAQPAKKPNSSNSSNTSVTNDGKPTAENSLTKNCTSLPTQHNGDTLIRQMSETENRSAPINSQTNARETKTNSVEDKSALQTQKDSSAAAQIIEENARVSENNTKKSINNNNNSTTIDSKPETQKECVKSASDTKMGHAGSKIDALSAKLQFQPKMGQVNNTYSKKAPKEKRTMLQNVKKSDIKSTESTKAADAKTRTNCGSTAAKASITFSSPQKSTVSSTVASQNTSIMDPSSKSSKQEALYEKDNQDTSIDVQQALNLLEQKMTSHVQALAETFGKTSHVGSDTINQRLQCVRNSTITPNENIVSTVPNVSTSTMSQTTSTFPYTVHDLVTNAALKSTLKNSSGGCAVPKSSDTSRVACSTSSSQMPISMSQFSMPSMSIYSIPTSLKNNHSNTSQIVTTVTTMSATTITTTAASRSAPTLTTCPDAIPISLMKQSMRKQEATAKGSNLNDICAKIGSNTTGSKINDICAKIGENSKEKNRIEARNKSDIPDLLKITKKSSSSSLPNSDTAMKHIPNIPNVPVYAPSTNMTIMESKNTKVSTLPTSVATSAALTVSTSSGSSSIPTSHVVQKMSFKKQSQPIGYKTLRDPPKSWNPTLSKNNYVAVKNQAKEMQNQTQTSASEGTSKQIPSKPAKIFKMKNMPRYLGNPASGVKPMYGVTNDAKEKEQSTTNTKSPNLNMMKIDPKTLSPIVSPPPYSPNTRSYQNTPFSRDICRNTGSSISSINSSVNILSTNPFIPSPTPNTNPRIIYSHFATPFPDARFSNPLIRSPIPPSSAFHTLPPSINKHVTNMYQRSPSYLPQTTVYSPVPGQPPTVQRIPPSTHSSSPKSPKTSSPSSISSASFNLGKAEHPQPPITTAVESVALLLSKSVPVSVPVAISPQRELNVFNLSKTGSLTGVTSNIVKKSVMDTSDIAETRNSKQNSSTSTAPAAANVGVSEGLSSPNNTERKQCKDTDVQKTQETTRCREEDAQTSKKPAETRRSAEIVSDAKSTDKKEKNQTTKVNGDVTTERFGNKKSKEGSNDENETKTPAETSERDGQERSSSRERNSVPKSNAQTNINESFVTNDSKSEALGKADEQIQSKKSETQRNKAET